MPLVRITLAAGRPLESLQAVGAGVHQALVEAAGVPPEDRFQIVEEVPASRLFVTPAYLGRPHTTDAVFVQVVLNRGRTIEVKQALYARIASAVAAALPVSADDVIVTLIEVEKENWSFGGGVMSYPP